MNDEWQVPEVVDSGTWDAARESLLRREKAYTREGDAIAAARRVGGVVSGNKC